MQPPPVATKAALRAYMRGRRTALTEATWASASARVCRALLLHPRLLAARSVALFSPLVARREIDVRPVAQALRERGVTLFYPSISDDSAVCTGHFRWSGAESSLVVGPFGIPQPADTSRIAVRGDLDVVVVPCLAVTREGARLGYGSGFYDRVLPSVCPPAHTLVVAFAFQVVATLPTHSGDYRCDEIVTDED
jgi:5-formyltetrahydrofolate cyclo-ligase